jgi:hypothetical protein
MKNLQYAANLWADQLGANQDNGDLMSNVFMQMAAQSSESPSKDQIEKFKTVLVDQMQKTMARDRTDKIWIGVDYNPDEEIAIACREAGINPLLLPVKSDVFVSEKEVKYKFGYGQPFTLILTEDIK